MQLNIKHIAILPPLLALLTACSWDELLYEDPTSPPLYEKTPIELSVGGENSPEPTTRAVITDGTGKTLNAFDVNTKIFMVMKSEYDTGNPDFAGAQTTKYNVARGDVAASSTTNITVGGNTVTANKVTFDEKNQRYWDDAHARSSQLSIWAYAQKGQSWTSCKFGNSTYNTEIDANQPYAWTTTEIVPTILTWRASHQDGTEAQNQTSVQAQDLLFSNNLAENGGNDNRLKFNFTTRKFPQVGEANMIFYHAMSKITIKIIEGEGFDTSSDADFQFTPSTSNVKLSGFNHTGKFDIKEGEFTEIADGGTTEIPSIYLKTNSPGSNPHYLLEALVIPNISKDGVSCLEKTKKNLATDVMMEFTIDNNKYQVTSGQLYDALHVGGNPLNALVTNATEKTDNGTYIPLEAGKNYVFTFTVGKTKIKNITAQVAEWEDVNAENIDPSNARITLNLEERGDALTSTDHFSFYRAAKDNTGAINDDYTTYDWKTGYNTSGLIPSYVSTAPVHWTTDLYWDSNLNYYHFRALAKDNGTSKVVVPNNVVTDAVNGDYYALASAVNYDDILWGAPMKDVEPGNDVSDAASLKWNYGPTTNGFDGRDDKASDAHQIYKAIGPTKDPVKLILFHMMSDLTINIKTTTGADAVDLGDGSSNKTIVELVDYKTGGKVLLGNGLVQATGDATTTEIAQNAFTAATVSPASSAIAKYVYGAVPQDLTNVKLRITTPDHNQYIVDLKDMVVASGNITSHNIANPYTTNSSGKYIINRWYPGFKYNYSFTLAKTGITNLQATIVDWENVSADNETVKIQ